VCGGSAVGGEAEAEEIACDFGEVLRKGMRLRARGI
jgi:hypothetical protein